MAGGPETLPRKKRLLFLLSSYLLLATAFLAVGEVGARLKGFKPYEVKALDIAVEPGGRLYAQDPVLGYKNLPGRFFVTLDGAYTFKVTNLPNTLRTTRPLDTYPSTVAKQEIWLFGDSITYGWSVNDDDTFAWLLQERFPDREIVNFGVNGYGTIHSLLQLRESLASGHKPETAVVAYASWADVRNTFIRGRRKMLAPAASLGPVNQPYARLNADGTIETFIDTVQYREVPLMRYSALINMLEEKYDSWEECHTKSHEVTKAILKEMADLCRSNGMTLAVAGLTSDPTTSDIMQYCDAQGIRTTSIWVDLTIKENNNLPFDSHPSAVAHRQYAQMLEGFLRPK